MNDRTFLEFLTRLCLYRPLKVKNYSLSLMYVCFSVYVEDFMNFMNKHDLLLFQLV